MTPDKLNRQRENALFLYTLALQEGNVEALESVFDLAENDSILADLLTEVETKYSGEYQLDRDEIESQKVRALLEEHLSTTFLNPDESEEEPTLLTVGDVLAEMKREAQSGPLAREAGVLLTAKGVHTTNLPEDLSRGKVQHLFGRIGLKVSQSFQNAFRNIGIHLLMQQQQQTMLQAARRQQAFHSKEGAKSVKPSAAENGQEE